MHILTECVIWFNNKDHYNAVNGYMAHLLF